MILPLVWSPTFQPAKSVPFGTGPTAFSMFLSPANDVDGWVWGVGPSALLPTSSNGTLGSNVWGMGPAFIVVKTAGPVVAGALVSDVFSLGGTSGRGGTKYDVFAANPFFNYNFGGGWFVGTEPTITSVRTSAGERWTLPVGAEIGRVVKIGGRLPVALLARRLLQRGAASIWGDLAASHRDSDYLLSSTFRMTGFSMQPKNTIPPTVNRGHTWVVPIMRRATAGPARRGCHRPVG